MRRLSVSRIYWGRVRVVEGRDHDMDVHCDCQADVLRLGHSKNRVWGGIVRGEFILKLTDTDLHKGE